MDCTSPASTAVDRNIDVAFGPLSPNAKAVSADNLLATPVSQVSTSPDSPSPFSRPYSSPSDSEEDDGDSHGLTGKNLFLSLGEPAWPEDTSAQHVLAPDGRVFDRTGGAATFDFVKEGSPSHSAKFEAIDVMRSLRAVRLAHAACEADAVARLAEDTDALSTNASECDVESSAACACSIDVAGVLRGTVFVKPASPATGASTVRRAKLLHRLHTRSRASKPGCVLCVGPDGRVCLQPGGPTTRQGLSRRERTDRRLTAVRRRQLFSTFRFRSPGVAPLPSIDATGAVHWPDAGPVIDIQGSRAVWDLSSEEVDIYAAV